MLYIKKRILNLKKKPKQKYFLKNLIERWIRRKFNINKSTLYWTRDFQKKQLNKFEDYLEKKQQYFTEKHKQLKKKNFFFRIEKSIEFGKYVGSPIVRFRGESLNKNLVNNFSKKIKYIYNYSPKIEKFVEQKYFKKTSKNKNLKPKIIRKLRFLKYNFKLIWKYDREIYLNLK